MKEELLAYKKNVKKRSEIMCQLVGLCTIEALLLMISIIAVIAAPPLGIIMLIGCFFFFTLILKVGKKCRAVGKEIKKYTSTHHRPSLNILEETTYCFVAPYSTQVTANKIIEVLSLVGKIVKSDPLHNTVIGKIQIDLKKMQKVTFYIERNDSQCRVRAVFKNVANDDWWDIFLEALFESSEGIDYGVSLANGAPQLAAVLHLGDETQQISYSKTKNGHSLGGFLVGGALFGTAGAVVGGLSGKSRTVTHTNTVFSNNMLVRVIYNNGRLWEGTIIKGSDIYNEIMVNM